MCQCSLPLLQGRLVCQCSLLSSRALGRSGAALRPSDWPIGPGWAIKETPAGCAGRSSQDFDCHSRIGEEQTALETEATAQAAWLSPAAHPTSSSRCARDWRACRPPACGGKAVCRHQCVFQKDLVSYLLGSLGQWLSVLEAEWPEVQLSCRTSWTWWLRE